MVWWWILLGVALAAAVELWVLWAQKRLSFWPDPQRRPLAGAEQVGFTEVEIFAGPGVTLVGWWRPPDSGRATVLYLPGNAGNIADRQFFLEELARRGYGVLGVNYRGYGGSSGSPSEKGIYADGLAAYGFLAGDKAVHSGQIIVYGQSIGGTVATKVAGERPVAGIVMESSFTSAQAMARRVIPFLPLWVLMTYRFDNIGRVQRIACPKLFVHGDGDETVPFAQAQQLFANAKEPKQLYRIAGAGHNDIIDFGGQAYFIALQQFIDSNTDRSGFR